MSGAASARDDDLNAALFRGGSIFKEQVGSAVSGDHARFMWNAELAERFGGKFHGIPVGAGAHDDANERVSDSFLVVARALLPLCLQHISRSFSKRQQRMPGSGVRQNEFRPALRILDEAPRPILYCRC